LQDRVNHLKKVSLVFTITFNKPWYQLAILYINQLMRVLCNYDLTASNGHVIFSVGK
jgi:hypothetical protein